jgi:ABC-type lipoprotein export system ATPase subunit
VITVTHDRRMIDGFDSVYVMNDGRIARAAGDPGSAATHAH